MGKPLPKSKWQQRLEEAQKMQEQQMRQRRK
jgi:YidC/Oxa1 family membrane protein insertase